jgi:hypothetical protein
MLSAFDIIITATLETLVVDERIGRGTVLITQQRPAS